MSDKILHVRDWWLFAFSLPAPYDTVPEQGHARAVALTWISFGLAAYSTIQLIAWRRRWPSRGIVAAAGPLVGSLIGGSWLLSTALFTSRIWTPGAGAKPFVQIVLAGPLTSLWHECAAAMLQAVGAFGTVAPAQWFGSGSSYHAPPDYLLIGLVADITLLVNLVTVVSALAALAGARRRRRGGATL